MFRYLKCHPEEYIFSNTKETSSRLLFMVVHILKKISKTLHHSLTYKITSFIQRFVFRSHVSEECMDYNSAQLNIVFMPSTRAYVAYNRTECTGLGRQVHQHF
jgi:putative IMPACT (imprinted ancient) family translation regulator